ncbi:sortilin-related receptor-like [Euwallacea fornicatus]|uniref:sortilin-related receptor-like n=1 Tax=Euwallacea fornicatus TaxID=995702 RepID=UPI00338F46A9
MILALVILCLAPNWGASVNSGAQKTLFGAPEPSVGTIFNFIQEDTPDFTEESMHRFRRTAEPDTTSSIDDEFAVFKVNHLNDSHKQLMVHWVGENSKVVICLARDPAVSLFDFKPASPSAVFISYDDGDTYINKTEQFKLLNGSYATLEKFYNHPRYNTHFVFTDVLHNMLYLTTNHGKDFQRIALKFTPSELSFHDLFSNIFVILDKNDTNNKLWITEDFGKTFKQAHEFVKAFFWIKEGDTQRLLVQRNEPNGLGSIIHSSNLFRNRVSQVYATNIKDFFIKGDYLFTTKNNSKGGLDLYVSYKLSKQLPCVFDTTEEVSNFFIADVTGGRALVATSHSTTSSNLYVSDNLNGKYGKVWFTLSIEDVFAFFPNSTWQGTLLHHISEEPFADVYKVEGLTGIYIASKVTSKPINNNLGPQHLSTLITFDHGASWRPIQAPAMDVEGQETCILSNGCSLHLSQKFSQLYPESRSAPILSSKSAPGTIIATGVLGSSLKGHYGVYISLDGGLTWRQTLRELYLFNMGDHGGILSAVKYHKTKGETRSILFSTDEGETWNITQFHNDEIRLYGLMTEPGENTTVFTMFGSLPKEHNWIIVKADFSKALPKMCTEEDYKMWSPSQSDDTRSYIPCVMGEQTTYQRRLRYARCLNGQDYTRVVSKKPCDCDVLDFECDFGFKKVLNKVPRCVQDKIFISYDPFKAPESCKPGEFYMRTKGYRKIPGDQCVQGFGQHYLPDNVPCPFKEIDDFLLFAQRENISRYNLITHTLEPLPIKNLKNVIAIDFDMENNCIYWADINLDTINRQCFSNGSKLETLVSNDLASIEGMAYDWISKTLYFVDGSRAKIELIRTDINHSGRMRKTILDNKTLKKPRGIAVHPQAGYLFWTDWSPEIPSVNRANLDGSNTKTLFGSDKVEWPNGITVDYIANRIYWVDARRDYIGSSDLHGDAFVNVVHASNVVSHPFAVAVFKSNMYWDDWKKNAIYSSDKDVYKGIEVVVKDLPGLMDLKVYAHGLQIGKNACFNASCSHICVGLPKNKFTCLCPDGMDVSKEGACLCPGGYPPLSNGTCASVGSSCSTEHFSCGNGLCVPRGWICDGEDDCGDNSDELRCGLSTCPFNFHTCGDGKCLPPYWKCDYDTDCLDGSDEKNCPKQNCTDNQFQCENGRCISKNWRCDGENDCRDNSDELGCDPNVPTQCKDDEFTCAGGAVKCIPSTWKCDEEPDCRDGTDELECEQNVCSDTQFACGPPRNRCIFQTWVCDGDSDCFDGRDEKNCTSNKPEISKIPSAFQPKNRTCQDWMFKCKNEHCIPFWWRCDSVEDCEDASDELECSKVIPTGSPAVSTSTRRPTVVCGNNQFRCLSGNCIQSSWVCDGSQDCPNGEDEQSCEESTVCHLTQFKCTMDGSCISRAKVCNGIPDCPDQSDETYCQEAYLPNEPATPSCSIGFFPCDGGSCFPLSVRCDGKAHCSDGYDEHNCTNKQRVYQVMQMGIGIKDSNENSLLLYWAFAPLKSDVKLEFLPSISKTSEGKWRNESWIDETEFKFKGLQPFTRYNMTVFVREKGKSTVFPPARYYIYTTQEGVPSAPLNVRAKQQNGSHVLVSWDKPLNPNGIIKNYQILWTPAESPPIKLKLNGNETSHLLSADFQHNQSYTFVVSAFNGKYEGSQSSPATIFFDGETVVHAVHHLVVTQKNVNTTGEASNVKLSWSYEGHADMFIINVTTPRDYPHLPSYTTKDHNISLILAPGVKYFLEIYAICNGFDGPRSRVKFTIAGTELPSIEITQLKVMKDVGTSVKLSWDRPVKTAKVTWEYGVYYGTTLMELYKPASYNTSSLSATISNLEACETYLFSVGLVGPFGVGPFLNQHKYQQVLITTSNPKAPPKNLKVEPQIDPANPLKMVISWEPSCGPTENVSYIIYITETTTNRFWALNVKNKLNHTVKVEHGGIYSISVSNSAANATESKPVIYEAPQIYPPSGVKLIPEVNGSFSLFWNEPDVKPNGPFSYEILVQDGLILNETTAQKFNVDGPPFVYTNDSSMIYSFAVRIKTKKGLSSSRSETLSKISEKLIVESSVNLPAIIIPSLLILISLIAVILFLVIRNRRLQNSFVRFASSHYSSRSGAATFDDNGLEEEESPRIMGFSDDEPLVVA